MAVDKNCLEGKDIDQIDDSFVIIEKCYLGEANGVKVKSSGREKGDCDYTISNFK